jgi:hypothetical protein
MGPKPEGGKSLDKFEDYAAKTLYLTDIIRFRLKSSLQIYKVMPYKCHGIFS